MEATNISIEKLGVRTGILTALTLIIYFILMHFGGLLQFFELRMINFIFLTVGVVYAIRHFKQRQQWRFNYFNGLAVGFLTAFISMLLFALFLYVYLQWIDPSFMRFIIQTAVLGNFPNPASVAGAILVEGGGAGAVIAFGAMQYFKEPETDVRITDEDETRNLVF